MGEPWFGAKEYGIGISPKTPAGWISLFVYVAAMATAPRIAHQLAAPHWAIWLVLATLTIAFFALVAIKSDRQPWRWRWGGR
jgi:hypothetical protein